MEKRVIKFRAWLIENHSGKAQMFYQGDQYLQSFLRRCAMFSNGQGRDHEKYGNYELEQFTGLYDRDGKEIYEGDIVICHDHPTGVDDVTGEVYFEHGHYKAKGSIVPLHDYGSAWVTVVGHIHENKLDLWKQ